MNKFAFIHHGARVRWNDPAASDYGDEAKDHLTRTYIVFSINGQTKGLATEEDDIVLIYEKGSGSEAEVYASELVEVPETKEERVTHFTRSADLFLLSCIKYADMRRKTAEREAKEAKEELQKMFRLSKEEKAAIAKEKAYAEMKQTLSNLEQKIADLREQLNYYMSAYLILKQPKAERIDQLEEGFKNTPDHLARFLLGVPTEEPEAMDPDVRVVCENEEGEIFPVTDAWYDKERAMVRLTIDTE